MESGQLGVDIRRNVCPPGYTRGRCVPCVLLWWFINATLFRWTPRFCNGWRRFLLRLFGAKIGVGVLIRESVRVHYPWRLEIGDYSSIGEDVNLYTLDRIVIGKHSVVSQASYLCTGSHDIEDPHMTLIVKPITIGDGVWIAADVFVAPGVNIGNLCVIGARSTVLKDMPDGLVCYGYPCEPRRPRVVRGHDG